jgi:hypothetical protein
MDLFQQPARQGHENRSQILVPLLDVNRKAALFALHWNRRVGAGGDDGSALEMLLTEGRGRIYVAPSAGEHAARPFASLLAYLRTGNR